MTFNESSPAPLIRREAVNAMAEAPVNLASYLLPAAAIDSDKAAVIAFAREVAGDVEDPGEKARRLYLAVRDRFKYDPYKLDLSVEGVSASRVLEQEYGWCVSKSGLLVAACRALGIPARIGFADVHNHLSTRRLRETLGTDTYYWHGYASLYLDRKWVKATPVFNIDLCRVLKMAPLEFDGTRDSILQACDEQGNRHMEYVKMHGEFLDIPIDEIRATYARCYPRLVQMAGANFGSEVLAEAAGGGTTL